jgi:hypothetical protein
MAPAAMNGMRDAAKRARLAWYELDFARVAGKQQFLAVCARGLRLPDWFGANWDALSDCLKDMEANCVVSCRNTGAFSAAAPDDYATALEVFRDATNYWSERGLVFIVLLDRGPAGVALPNLTGA